MTSVAPRSNDAAAADHTVVSGPGHIPDVPDDATWRRWGIDPAWSRRISVPSRAGRTHVWHVLDTGDTAATIESPVVVCVHGNPTWSYLWRPLLAALNARHRVIAVDQLGMGYSERTVQRRYAERVADLTDMIDALDIDRPIVLAGHDWGGAVSMGWAVQTPERLAGLVLCNTGITVPDRRQAPALIRVAASAPLLDALCRGTPVFLEGTLRLSGRRLSRIDREAFRAPYRAAPDRAAIADFVDDAPLYHDHPSAPALAEVAAKLHTVDAPVLLTWGAKDPVFNDDFAADLAARFPHVVRHRLADAGHLSVAEADVAGVVDRWLDEIDGTTAQPRPLAPPSVATSLWAAIDERAGERTDAVVDLATGDSLSWASLARRVNGVAGLLHERGLRPGDRVAVLTPPGVDLIAVVYGVWRAGGVTVIADRGLGLRGLGAAVRSARPQWVIGPRRALVAAQALRWTPRATHLDVADLVAAVGSGADVPVPAAHDPAAVLFTSGATGAAKGVRYLHRQLTAQRDALARAYAIGGEDRLVAAFAPFALYGPALGIPTALPDIDVTKPSQLTAAALDAACARIGATLAFASPTAIANVVATASVGESSRRAVAALRLVLSAGAPVPSEQLAAMSRLVPHAELHTPYGMTEALPVADIDLAGILAAEADEPTGGVCVGLPVAGAEVRITALGSSDLTALAPGVTGEILVRAPWVSDGYDGLWATERAARPGEGWHRSGDVGHLDGRGRLWVEGRSAHVIDTVDGAVTPVPVERAVERALPGSRVAAVGVGPSGCQQVVVVVEVDDAPRDGLAAHDVADQVRQAAPTSVAAVLAKASLPVDIRHNAKIDRTALAAWAGTVLAGGRAASIRRPWRRS